MIIHRLSAELCAATSLPVSIFGMNCGGGERRLRVWEDGVGLRRGKGEVRAKTVQVNLSETAFCAESRREGKSSSQAERAAERIVGRRHDVPPTARIVDRVSVYSEIVHRRPSSGLCRERATDGSGTPKTDCHSGQRRRERVSMENVTEDPLLYPWVLRCKEQAGRRETIRGEARKGQVQRRLAVRGGEGRLSREGFTRPVPLARCLSNLVVSGSPLTRRHQRVADSLQDVVASFVAREFECGTGGGGGGSECQLCRLARWVAESWRYEYAPNKDFAERSDRLSVLVLFRVCHLEGARECQLEVARTREGEGGVGGCTWRFM